MVPRQVWKAAPAASLAILGGLLCILTTGCAQAGPAWSWTRPGYVAGSVSWVVSDPEGVAVVIRPGWFGKRWGMTDGEAMMACSKAVSSGLLGTIPGATILPDSTVALFAPSETHKISERIFLRGRFPYQGDTVRTQTGVPTQILLLHSLDIGTGVYRKDLFDYANANHYEETTARPTEVTAVCTWTLWDNLRQRPLVEGVSEARIPISKATDPDALKALGTSIATDILSELGKGVAP